MTTIAPRMRLVGEQQKVRVSLKRLPGWEDTLKPWSISHAARNLWRVQPVSDMEDLINDAFLIYDKCLTHYPHVTDPRHFMSLFMRSFINHVHTLANDRTRHSHTSPATLSEDATLDTLSESTARDLDELEVRLLLEDAPEILRPALRVLLGEGRKPSRWVGETMNEYLCRLARVDPAEHDLDTLAADWLEGGNSVPHPEKYRRRLRSPS